MLNTLQLAPLTFDRHAIQLMAQHCFLLMTSGLVRILIRNAQLCILCIYMSKWWVCDLYIDVLLMGERMASGGLPFPYIGCPVPDVGYIYLIWNYECVRHCFCTYPPRLVVSVHALSLRKTDWASYFGRPLYEIYILLWTPNRLDIFYSIFSIRFHLECFW